MYLLLRKVFYNSRRATFQRLRHNVSKYYHGTLFHTDLPLDLTVFWFQFIFFFNMCMCVLFSSERLTHTNVYVDKSQWIVIKFEYYLCILPM